MKIRSDRARRFVHFGAAMIERLERRDYLTGVVLGTPVNLAASSVGLAPTLAGLADFNGDGKADLYVANSSGSVSILTSSGGGSFAAPVTVPVAGTPVSLATGSFDNSNPTHLGIVAGTTGSPGDISLILGNGNGTFGTADNIPALANNQAIAVGDFTNNGDEDVITVSGAATPTNNAMLLLGNGAGGLTAQLPFSLPFGNVSAVAVGDFNGDGNLDFVVANQLNNSVSVFLGNGNGTFSSPTTYATGPSPTSIAVGNFTGENLSSGRPSLDIVTADSTGGEISFLGNNGTGGFEGPINTIVSGSATGGGPVTIQSANFSGASTNQDLIALLSPGGSAQADVLLGNGDGTWHLGDLIAGNGTASNTAVAGDLNGDGFTDVALTNSSQISALLNVSNQDTTTPSASVDASQAQGSTLSTTYNFTVTYTDSEQIDASTLGNGNLVVEFSDGVLQPVALVSKNFGNGASVDATYQLKFVADLTTADAGTYTVMINPGSVENAGGVAVPAGNIGTFNLVVGTQNTTAPTAVVDATQAPGTNQATAYDFSVTYTDPVAVDVSTLGNSNLTVTFPNNSQSQAATLVSTGLTNGPTVQAFYQISFPQGLSPADEGGYQVSINANSVKDTTGLAVAAGIIGTFTLAIDVAPTGDFAVSAPTGKFLSSVVASSKQKGGATVVITYNGATILKKAVVVTTLYASTTQINDGSAVQVGTASTKKVATLKPGNHFTIHFAPFAYPAAAGSYYLVSDVSLNGTLDSYDGATATPISVQAPFVDAEAIAATPVKSTLVAGKNASAIFTIENIGNIAITGKQTVDVELIPAGSPGGTAPTDVALAIPIPLHLNPSQTKKVHVNFKPTTLPASGSYDLVLVVHVAGDTDSSNDMVTSTATIGT